MGDFQLQRIGMVMEPEPGNPMEIEGVLNPASARGPDGELYLYPRLGAKGNYSRIGIGRVLFNTAGEPQGVVANVVFPTAIDRRDDLGSPDRFDVYFGMVDSRIGVAKHTDERVVENNHEVMQV